MTTTSLTRKEIALHWIVGIGVMGMLGLGLYMSTFEVRGLMPLHKSIGTVLFVFILWRTCARLIQGWPEKLGNDPKWQRDMALIVHWVLIIGTVLMPVSGMMSSIGGGRGLAVFGVELIAANLDGSGKPQAINAQVSDLGGTLHVVSAYVLIAGIVLHIAGALKHHFIDGDGTLRRMLGASVPVESCAIGHRAAERSKA